MAEFYTILTTIGKAKLANSAALGTKLNLTKFQVGDGGGAYYNPTENQTSLKNKVWEGSIGSISVDSENPNWIILETIISSQDGGFIIREAGVFDDNNDLIAIGKYPETYKPVLAEGSAKDLIIKMILEVSNTSSVTLKVDPTVIIATKKDIEVLEQKIKDINVPVKSVNGKIGEVVLSADDINTSSGKTIQFNLENIETSIGDKKILKTTDKSNIVGAVNELFTNVSNGKELIASAITDKGISTSENETFDSLATKISRLKSGKQWLVDNGIFYGIDSDFISYGNLLNTNGCLCAKSNNNKYLLLNNVNNKSIHIFNNKFQEIYNYKYNGAITGFCVDDTGSAYFSYSSGDLYKINSGGVIWSKRIHESSSYESFTQMAVDKNNNNIALYYQRKVDTTGYYISSFRVHNTVNGSLEKSTNEERVRGVVFGGIVSDIVNNYIYFLDIYGNLNVYDSSTNEILNTLQVDRSVVSILSDGINLYLTFDDGIKCYRTSDYSLVYEKKYDYGTNQYNFGANLYIRGKSKNKYLLVFCAYGGSTDRWQKARLINLNDGSIFKEYFLNVDCKNNFNLYSERSKQSVLFNDYIVYEGYVLAEFIELK